MIAFLAPTFFGLVGVLRAQVTGLDRFVGGRALGVVRLLSLILTYAAGMCWLVIYHKWIGQADDAFAVTFCILWGFIAAGTVGMAIRDFLRPDEDVVHDRLSQSRWTSKIVSAFLFVGIFAGAVPMLWLSQNLPQVPRTRAALVFNPDFRKLQRDVSEFDRQRFKCSVYENQEAKAGLLKTCRCEVRERMDAILANVDQLLQKFPEFADYQLDLNYGGRTDRLYTQPDLQRIIDTVTCERP